MFVDKFLLAFGAFLIVIGGGTIASGSFEMVSWNRMSSHHVDGSRSDVLALLILGVGIYCVLRAFGK